MKFDTQVPTDPHASTARIVTESVTLVLRLDEDDRLEVSTHGGVHGDVSDSARRRWLNEAIRAVALDPAGVSDDTFDTFDTATQYVTDALFPGDVGKLIEGLVENLKRHPRWRLQIRLILDDERLAAIPWELARPPYVVGVGAPELGFDERFSIVRDPASKAPRTPLDLSGPIRVLSASAHRVPGHADVSGGEDVIKKVAAAVDALEVDSLADVTASELRLALRRGCRVFHFSGHGVVGQRTGIVVNVKHVKGSTAVNDVLGAEELARLLGGKVDVAVLACCHSGGLDDDTAWASVAGALVGSGAVPTVIAMQRKIGRDEAARFTGAFYEALVATRSIDDAVAAGRAALKPANRAIPVVYSRALPASASASASAPAASPAPESPASRAPRAAAPIRSRALPEALGALSLDHATWAVVRDGRDVGFAALAGEGGGAPWRLDAPIADAALTPDGWTLVALAGGCLHVAGLDEHGGLHPWKATFAVPAGTVRVLAVRRPERKQVEALVSGPAGQATAVCFLDGRHHCSGTQPGTPRDAAALDAGFVTIGAGGELQGPADPQLAALRDLHPAGWVAVDSACTQEGPVTAAAHEDGDVVAVTATARSVRAHVPGACRVHVVRRVEPGAIASVTATTAEEILEWELPALEPLRRDGAPA